MVCTLRTAAHADVPLLAEMNARLIQDQGSRNPMGLEQLEERMVRWLMEGWRAELFLEDGSVAGYALYRVRADEYFPARRLVHLRHFFVERGHRRRGLGSEALGLLRQGPFPRDAYVVIDVLSGNTDGRLFWEHNGFSAYATTMHLGHCPGSP